MLYYYTLFIVLLLSSTICAFENLQLCKSTDKTHSCTTQILGHNHTDDKCQVEYFPANSALCKAMNFGPIASNGHIGGVRLKPHILPIEKKENASVYYVNYTVLNITFSNIKWKTMKFRFQQAKYKNMENHCRNIVISNDIKINDQSVLYYDCFWSVIDANYNGQSHILDFEATDETTINRGQYYFNIPSAEMLSPSVREEDWKPFMYIEILTSVLRLHVLPPPAHVAIRGYRVQVMKECEGGSGACDAVAKNVTLPLRSREREVTYDQSLLRSAGSYYFIVTPLHDACAASARCQRVLSPRITISRDGGAAGERLGVCVASAAALVVAALFAYYVALRLAPRALALLRPARLPPPAKVLVAYPAANRVHAECVASFVRFLREEYGFALLFDGDMAPGADPYAWAEAAFRDASHVMYVAGPRDDVAYNLYDRPIVTANKHLDLLILTLVKASRARRRPKAVLNVLFEHSSRALPAETRHDKPFLLLKDWHKLIAYLSQNMLPRKSIMRSERGRCFLDDLDKAKKLLTEGQDVFFKEKIYHSDKKVLL